MYWFPQRGYYPMGDFRQMPPMSMPEMERMRQMMERHFAVTNETLGVVRDNNRMLRAIQAHLTGLPPREPEERDLSTGEGDIPN
ncbi:hypothetical protein [Effusibacillus consociatus]|uniref:Uncharacterized protein n=1 Tax=Effusibacillus consociatus TaxID=1117041 RepID=A0ABV9Q719_9BACL